MTRSSHPHANERRSTTLADQTAGLGLFASAKPEPEPARVTPKEAREITHAAQKSKHPELITKLRIAAREAYTRINGVALVAPISTNDIRAVYDREGKGADQRILALAFAESYWTPFGETKSNTANAERSGITRSTIRTYVPTHLLSMWEEKAKADERRTA